MHDELVREIDRASLANRLIVKALVKARPSSSSFGGISMP
jgi:hypothetical protein